MTAAAATTAMTTMVTRTMVYCTFRREKFHKWSNAPDKVGFLRDLHRHEFHFKVSVEVSHDDREVEFILLKRWCEELVDSWPEVVGSCEMMGRDIIAALKGEYGGILRHYRVEVSEDGESGAIVEE